MNNPTLVPSQVRAPLSSSDFSPTIPTPPTPPTLSDSPVGDSIHDKPNNTTRIVLQNPNGFSTENQLFEYQLCLDHMASASADIILLPETNLCWSHYHIIQQTTTHRKNKFRFSKQVTSNSNQVYETSYQPGGTASLLTGDLVSRHQSSSSDDILGRWTVTNLTLKNNGVLSLICCYQVCDQSIQTAGPKTAFTQQWSLLRQQGYLRPNPRKQFYTDLCRLLTSLHRKGHHILLAGDFNSSVGDDVLGLDRIIHQFQLVDCVQQRHGSYSCSTYSRGSRCLDYILLSQSLAHCIARSGVFPLLIVLRHQITALCLLILTTPNSLERLFRPLFLSSSGGSSARPLLGVINMSNISQSPFDTIRSLTGLLDSVPLPLLPMYLSVKHLIEISLV